MRLRRIVVECSRLSRLCCSRSNGRSTGARKQRGEFAAYIAEYPDAGDVVPESGGIRKVRWGRAGSGKSGGVRVINFMRSVEEEVVLLTLYAKAKTDNITGAKLKEIRRAIES